MIKNLQRNLIRPSNTTTTGSGSFTHLDIITPHQQNNNHQLNDVREEQESKKLCINICMEFENDATTN